MPTNPPYKSPKHKVSTKLQHIHVNNKKWLKPIKTWFNPSNTHIKIHAQQHKIHQKKNKQQPIPFHHPNLHRNAPIPTKLQHKKNANDAGQCNPLQPFKTRFNPPNTNFSPTLQIPPTTSKIPIPPRTRLLRTRHLHLIQTHGSQCQRWVVRRLSLCPAGRRHETHPQTLIQYVTGESVILQAMWEA